MLNAETQHTLISSICQGPRSWLNLDGFSTRTDNFTLHVSNLDLGVAVWFTALSTDLFGAELRAVNRSNHAQQSLEELTPIGAA
jgi:hypothetical protein